MRKTSVLVKCGAVAASAATILALAACGNSGGTNSGQYKTQPASGIPVTYSGKLPMPDKTGVYNNPKSRDQLKDNGTVTYSTVELGPDWNNLSVNGNTSYMQTTTCLSCGYTMRMAQK